MKLEEKLKERILSRYKSVRAFSIDTNIPYSTIDNIFKRGIMGIGVTTAIKICDKLNLDVDRLADGELIEKIKSSTEEKNIPTYDNILPIETRKIPMLGSVACGQPLFCDQDFESYIEVGADVKADFCLRAKGDSMINARILDGDLVFIREQQDVANGEIAVVIIEDEATLKRVYKSESQIVLVAENPAYMPMTYRNEELEHIRILGKAIAFQSDIK